MAAAETSTDANADPFDEVFSVEDDYYKEGYDAGVADARYAGLVEGKLFGIEKGYQKALELGRLHGRALVWKARAHQPLESNNHSELNSSKQPISAEVLPQLKSFNANARLLKNMDHLVTLTGSPNIDMTNSDEAVAAFEERLAKAQAKAKIIANVVSEQLTNASVGEGISGGIEDARGLKARH